MIEDKQVAESVLDAAFAAGKELNGCFFDVLERCSDDEISSRKQAVGKCMGELLFELKNPILKRHPEWTPPEVMRCDN